MTFAQTYREERLINRRSRGRTARIAGRIIGFGLMACLLMALRTDPQLRSMVEDATIWAIGATDPRLADGADAQSAAIDAMNYQQGSEEAETLQQPGISGASGNKAPVASHMPQSRIKINRPNSG